MQVLKIKREAARKLLASDETFAFTLMTILLSTYGQDTFDENPVALFKNLEEDFNIKHPEESENRINAALTAMTTDLFFTQRASFKAITLALNEGDIGDIVEDGEGEYYVSDEPHGFSETANVLLGEDISSCIRRVNIEEF